MNDIQQGVVFPEAAAIHSLICLPKYLSSKLGLDAAVGQNDNRLSSRRPWGNTWAMENTNVCG